LYTGAVKIYVAAVNWKYRMKFSLQPKLVEKLVWVPVVLLCKIFIPSYAIMLKLRVLTRL